MIDETVKQVQYSRACFDVRNIDQARRIILTPEDTTTDQRWALETPYLAGLIDDSLSVLPRHRVLDYGCGIGRMSKALINLCGCSVIGIDTSVSMRSLAPSYVVDDRFFACSPETFDTAVHDVHFAIAVWTLQHIPEIDAAIWRIHQKMRSWGKLFVVNMHTRAIPTADGRWVDDLIDVREKLGAQFNEIAHGRLDRGRTTPSTATNSFWGCYQKRT